MTDQTVTVLHQPSPRSSVRGQPTPQHEEIIRLIQSIIREELENASTTMGTVVGYDGGMVRVQLDEEGGPREVGIPAIKGQRHSAGNRVFVHRMRGKDYVIGGSVTSNSAGFDPAVGNENVHTGAIDYRALHPSVPTDISTARSRAETGIDKADDAKGTANDARSRADAARSRADSAYGYADNAYDRAGNAQSTANTAKSRADSAYSKATYLSGRTLTGTANLKNGSVTIKVPGY